MSDGKVQLEAELDASRVKQGAAEVTGAVRQMGREVERESSRVSAATAKMGSGGEQAAQSTQKAERSIIASIQRQTAAYEAGGRSTREYYEAIARQRGIGADVLKPYLDQLDAAKEKQAEAAQGAKGFGDSLGMVRAGIAGIVGGALVGWAKQTGAALFDASVSAERLRTMLNFATGNSARDIEYLRGVTQSLGLEMQSTAAAYGQFAAASKGTALEGQKTKEVFESIAKASAVMGLSADQTSGVLLALQQMVSKGTVQAEELRGQLGERLPGAFQVAARAMGVTTAELGKMLESGSVVADDFLPKFAKALDEYVGDSAESAATRLEASQSRMSNAWERLMQAVGDSGVSSTMAVGMESAASSIDAIAVAMEAARRSGDGMGGQLLAAAGATLSLLDPTERLTVNLYDNERASKAAWERLRDLESQAARGVNVKAEYQQVINLINTLQIARHEMAKLRQEASGVATVGDRPRDLREDNPSLTRGASYSRWAKEQAEAEKGLMDVRMKATGINKSYFDDLGKYQAALRAGIITEKDYTAAVSKLATETWKSSAAGKAESESKKGRAKASDDAARAAEREVKAYQAFLNGLREKIAGQELELQNGKKLSAADRERLELEKLLANGRFQMTESRKAEIEAGLKRLDQLDQEREKVQRAVEAYQEWVDTQQELARAEVEASKGREAASRAIDEYIAGVVESQELLKLEASTIGMTSEKRAVALAQMRVELELRKKIAEINANPNGNPEWRALEIERVTQWAQVEKVNAAQRAIYDEWQKTADSINQSLTDALLRGFEDGKGFAKNFRDTLVNMFKTLVLRPVIEAVISPIGVGLTGMLGGGAAMAQGGGGFGGAGSLLNAGSSLLSGVTGFGGALSAGVGYGLSGVLAGNGIGTMLSAGTSMLGAGSIAGGLGTLLGVAAPVLAPLALLGLSGAFSRKHEQRNLQGVFGGETGFEGNWHDYYKGGLFRSSKTVDTPLEADFLKGLRDAWKASEAAVTSYAQTLGLSTDAIAGFTHAVNIKLKDLDPKASDYQQQVMARVTEAIRAGSNEMAELLIGSWDETVSTVTRQVRDYGDGDGWRAVEETVTTRTYTPSEYAREGEQAIDTLTRLGTSLQATNAAFDMLGTTLFEASLAGGDMASMLIDQMGGTEAFGAQVGSYWQAYYSEAERAAYVTGQITEALAEAGLEMPTTRDGFRALVDAQDLTTESGREAFAALMGVSGAFAEITPAAESVADAAARLAEEARKMAEEAYSNARSATDAAFNALEKFIGSQRDMWQTALDAAESLIDEARSIFDTAGGAARELWGQQDETRAMLAGEGNAVIQQMLASLRATGALPDADALSRAIDGARGGLDPAAYARTADQEFAQRVLAGQLGEMSDLAGGQMTVAEQQAEYARQQIKQLDDTLDYWRKQLDLMRNTDLTVTSIADGIGKLVAAMEEERAAQAALDAARNAPAPSTGNPANAGWAIGGSSGSGGGSGGAYLDYTDFTRRYADGGAELLNMNEVWMALWNSSGGDRAAAEAAYAAEEERRRREGIPSFDVGTNYVPRDMIAQIHEGERIIPAADNARLMALLANASQGGQNDALVAEVKALRAEVTALRAERTAADVPLHRMAGQFANVTAGGNAMMTETA